MMKRFLSVLLTLSLLCTLGALGASAISANVTADSWAAAELQALYIQSDGDVYSDLNEDYYEFWWEDEVPESEEWLQACTINMRGFAMSPDGRYLYMGTLNGGTGVRGAVVFDTQRAVVTDLYYHYDGAEIGLAGSPYSYAKGIATDDRGYVYVGFAFSKNYNIVNLGIAEQKDDGTLEELSLEAVYEFGAPGDEGGIHVGVNGVDVAKVGDKYYCYVMTNYDYDALYCYDVTDPANPKLNKDFSEDGVIIFSEPSNTVAGNGFTLAEGQYMDVDDDGTIWLVVNANEGTDGIMKIAPDGSACVEFIEHAGIYCVEHEGGYILCGLKDGSAVVVLDDASYETVATVPVTADYGDRITRIQVVNDVLFICDAGNDTTLFNAIHAAPLSAEGHAFFEELVANLAGDEEDPEVTADESVSDVEDTTPTEDGTTAPDTSAETKAPEETDAATNEDTTPVGGADTASDTDVTEEGCASVVGISALLMALAAAVALRKKD